MVNRSDDPTIETVLADPSCSNWLRNALTTALTRDPVDAANDAEVMAKLLAARADAIADEAIRVLK